MTDKLTLNMFLHIYLPLAIQYQHIEESRINLLIHKLKIKLLMVHIKICSKTVKEEE